MGGEGGFIQKLMALLGSAGAGPQNAQPAPSPTPTGKPWEDPSLAPHGGGMHMMPGGQMMPDAAMPAAAPTSIADDPMAQAVKLARQRELISKMAPEGAWNR